MSSIPDLIPQLRDFYKRSREKYRLLEPYESKECRIYGQCEDYEELISRLKIPGSVVEKFRDLASLGALIYMSGVKGVRTSTAGMFTVIYRPRPLEELARRLVEDWVLDLLEDAEDEYDLSYKAIRDPPYDLMRSQVYVYEGPYVVVAFERDGKIEAVIPPMGAAIALGLWRREPEEWLVWEMLGADRLEPPSRERTRRDLLEPGYSARILLPGGIVWEPLGVGVSLDEYRESRDLLSKIRGLLSEAADRVARFQFELYNGLGAIEEGVSLAEAAGMLYSTVMRALARGLGVSPGREISVASIDGLVNVAVGESISAIYDAAEALNEPLFRGLPGYKYIVAAGFDTPYMAMSDGLVPGSVLEKLCGLSNLAGDIDLLDNIYEAEEERAPRIIALRPVRLAEGPALLVVARGTDYGDTPFCTALALANEQQVMRELPWTRPPRIAEHVLPRSRELLVLDEDLSKTLYAYTRHPQAVSAIDSRTADRLRKLTLPGIWRVLGKDKTVAAKLAYAVARISHIVSSHIYLVHAVHENGDPSIGYIISPVHD